MTTTTQCPDQDYSSRCVQVLRGRRKIPNALQRIRSRIGLRYSDASWTTDDARAFTNVSRVFNSTTVVLSVGFWERRYLRAFS